MYCRECGRMVDDGSKFCPSCGISLGVPETGAEVSPHPLEAQLDGSPNPPAGMPQPMPPRYVAPPVPGTRPHLASQPQQQEVPGGKRRPRKGWVTLLLTILMQLLVFVYALVGAVLFYGMPDMLDVAVTVAMAIGAVVGVAIMGGRRLISFDRKAIWESFRQGIWYFGTSVALFLLSIGPSFTDESFAVSEGWPLRLVQTLVFCIAIGVSEEGVFRGLQLGGLLDVFGRTKRGVVVAVLASSLLFGLAHVDPTTISLAEPITLVQAILKVIQTGEMGFLLATIVLRTGSIMGGAALHAIGDFLLMFTSIVLEGQSTDISYVETGDEAFFVAGYYVFVIALYLPMVVRGIRLLRETEAPHYGAFHRGE